MSQARFFYYIPENMGIVNLIISPGHYGRSLSSILESERTLLERIEPLKECLIIQDVNCSIEIGASSWDKSVVRIRAQLKYTVPKEKLIEQLEVLSFHPIVPGDFGHIRPKQAQG